jgi:hypothetical protein
MKPSGITSVLDLAWAARQNGQMINPRFIGSAGIAKSAIIRQWADKMKKKYSDFQLIDLRIAYLEAPDLIGMVDITTDKDSVKRTTHCLPSFWPTSGHGVIVLEEVARGNTSVMNCLMQLLAERQVGPDYKLPDGWIITAADNQEDPAYDLNSLDLALRNRFMEVNVEYDSNTFIDYMAEADFCPHIQSFVKSGVWIYKEANALGINGKYISPRTWHQLHSAHVGGALDDVQLHHTICLSILGKEIGNEFWRFVHDDAPVTYADLLKNKKKALKKLAEQSKPEKHQGDKISVTIESISKNFTKEKEKDKITLDILIEVAKIIPADMAIELLKTIMEHHYMKDVSVLTKKIEAESPELIAALRANIKHQR